MVSKKIILLDVHVEGMANFLRDLDWKVTTVTELFGPTELDRKDDKIVNHTKNKQNFVVVTQDQNLIKRCMNLDINVIGIEMNDLAKVVNEKLHKKF